MTETHVFELLTFPQTVAEWPVIRPLLERAVVHGRGELVVEDILKLVSQDRMFISVLRSDHQIALAVAAEIIHYPRRKVLNLAFAGGRDSRIVSERYFDQLREMALRLGADRIQCHCREAVARLLKQMRPKAQVAYIILEEEVA